MPLTPEQQQALDELFANFPAASPSGQSLQPGWLETWLGLSGGDLKSALELFLAQKRGYQDKFLDWLERDPMDANLEFLGIAAWVFYQAEKGVNPKVKTYIDAFYYISTCASVGYADIFAATQTGRAVAALVMIVGPALTQKSLDHSNPKSPLGPISVVKDPEVTT
jgi:Ion channel